MGNAEGKNFQSTRGRSFKLVMGVTLKILMATQLLAEFVVRENIA